MWTGGLLFLVGTGVAAGGIPKPEFSIGLNFDHDTSDGSLGAAVPRVTWSSEEMSVAEWFNAQGGLDSTLTNIRKLPETYVWGEAKRVFPNKTGAIAIRGDMNTNSHEVLDLDLRVNGLRNAAALRLIGSASFREKTMNLDTMLASTRIDAPFGIPGKLMVNPRYDVKRKVPDAIVGYSCRNTSLKIDVQQRRFTLAHNFGVKNRNQIVPSLAMKSGDFSLSYCRYFSGSGRVITTWRPDDSIAVRWSDGDWDATIHKSGSGVKVSMKRSIGISLY